MDNRSLDITRPFKMSLTRTLFTVLCVAGLLVSLPSQCFADAKVSPDNDKVIRIVIRDNGFAPNEITDFIHRPVHLKVMNAGQHMHEFAIPEYRIYTRNLNPGEISDIQFSPWEAGSFVMYSDPIADSHPEFAGRFIVLPTGNQN